MALSVTVGLLQSLVTFVEGHGPSTKRVETSQRRPLSKRQKWSARNTEGSFIHEHKWRLETEVEHQQALLGRHQKAENGKKKSGFQDDKHNWEQMEGVSKKCY